MLRTANFSENNIYQGTLSLVSVLYITFQANSINVRIFSTDKILKAIKRTVRSNITFGDTVAQDNMFKIG